MPLQLFPAPDAVTRETIEGLHATTSYEFRSLMCLLLERGLLDAILAVPQNGSPMSRYEALVWWSKHFSELEHTIVSCCDMSSGRPHALNRLAREIREMQGNKNVVTQVQQRLGAYTHAAVLNYLQGGTRHIVSRSCHDAKPKNFTLFTVQDHRNKIHQIPLIRSEQGSNPDGVYDLDALRDVWKSCVMADEWTNRPLVNYLCIRDSIPQLIELLRPFYGCFIDKICADPSPANQYYGYYTLLTLAAVVLHRDTFDVGQIITQEKRVIHNHQVSLGRVDACTTHDIHNTQLRYVDVFDYRSKSVAELATYLQPLEMEVLDVKCSVGDDVDRNRDRFLPHDIERGEWWKHVHQMRRYLVMIPLAKFLQVNGFYADQYDPRTIWNSEKSYGSLMYLFPECAPVIRPQAMSADEQIDWFCKNYVDQWDGYHKSATIRMLANRIVNHTSKARNGCDTYLARPKAEHPSLFADPQAVPFSQILYHHRDQFAVYHDPKTRFIESRGESKKHTPRGIIHLDRLAYLIKKGTVQASRWDQTGGMVSCPIHGSDTTPSLHLDFQNNFWHCFGCGASGWFHKSKIPAGITVNFDAKSLSQGTGKIIVPAEHHQIMSDALDVLQQNYRMSPGFNYLWNVRKLDPELAFQYGAGYATDEQFIAGMRDKGWTLSQLIYYGFVGFYQSKKDEKISPDSRLMDVLRRYYTERGIQRDKSYQSPNGNEVRFECNNRPFLYLSGRVCFPLQLPQGTVCRNSNFYGRSVYPNSTLPHIKLNNKHHGVKNVGGVNVKIILDPNISEILIVEAPIDVLTQISIGMENTLGIIGTGNHELFCAIAKAQQIKHIGLGFDNDTLTDDKIAEMKRAGTRLILPPGQAATERTVEYLTDNGYRGGFSYHTHFTLGSNDPFWHAPDGSPCKDWNEWWCCKGRVFILGIKRHF